MGKVGGVITSDKLIVMLSVPVVAVFPSESVTFTVNVEVPAAVGAALAIVPFVPKVRGFGSDPDAIVNVKPVPEPPLAVNVSAGYGTPTTPLGNEGGVIVSVGLILMLRLPLVAVKPSESVTLTVNVNVPAAVGVALAIVPLVPSVRGFGNDPDASVNV